jgi:hypothetical protein
MNLHHLRAFRSISLSVRDQAATHTARHVGTDRVADLLPGAAWAMGRHLPDRGQAADVGARHRRAREVFRHGEAAVLAHRSEAWLDAAPLTRILRPRNESTHFRRAVLASQLRFFSIGIQDLIRSKSDF